MLVNAAAERDPAEDHRQGQPDFVDPRAAEQSTSRRQQAQRHRGRQAMNHAQPGQANGEPVEADGVESKLGHVVRLYILRFAKIQHHIDDNFAPLARVPPRGA